ncbi:hypothetical protein BS50DRAFT_118820 [Corynespora cassiicola Philippines]|uniref:Uncharacterized protein n=1 Tax=Corynespora cassiicola Philippines TaxID=1448308 RepID=A0A2T2NAI5_CORCC|nr:hypothetical protein BS50DRAFT_118820 [Corynespora cassiicola Philippines]
MTMMASVPVPPAIPQASTFLQLPRELRNKVYFHIWQSFYITIRQGDIYYELKFCFDDQCAPDSASSAWLFTSKQFLHEGISEFYQHARCDKAWAVTEITCNREGKPCDNPRCRFYGFRSVEAGPSSLLDATKLRHSPNQRGQ